MSRKTLKEQIAELSKPSNLDFDIEDAEMNLFDNFEEPNSGSESEVQKTDIHDDSHYVAVPKSKLRDNSIKVSSKYDGKVANRDELFNSVDKPHFSEVDEEDVSEESEESEESENNENSENSEQSDIEDGENDDNEVSLSDSSEDLNSELEEPQTDLEDESFKRQKLKSLMKDERKHIVQKLSTSVKSDALKGYAVLQQQLLFDQVVDSRIKIQKLLTLANQLPLTKSNFEETGMKDKKVLKETKTKIFSLLDKVFEVRSLLYQKENITKEVNIVNNKKRTFDEYLKTTEEYDEVLNKYRDNVLLKWSHRINSASGSSALNSTKFKLINQDSLKQVQNHLRDMEKLVKRTQLNRKKLKPVGGLILDLEQDDRSLQYSSYIFDDEDFYRVVLNDLIEKKLSQNEKLSSTIALSKQPTKLHKNYDKKASKGRKLNYQVQEPLANFEAPKKSVMWGDDQIDEFFAGLLGQKVDMNESEEDEDEEEQEVVLDTGLKLFG